MVDKHSIVTCFVTQTTEIKGGWAAEGYSTGVFSRAWI